MAEKWATPTRTQSASCLLLNQDPSEIQQWQTEVLRIFEKMRSEKNPYDLDCKGVTISILPNVYSPKYFTDSLWFAEELSRIAAQKTLLEIGTGSGIIAVFCARHGAHVVATDISAEAINNARLNAARHRVDISVREGNMYDPIRSDEKFDLIFWNHPFHNWNAPVADVLLRAGLDHNYEGLKEYIRSAKAHLSENGRLLLGTGDHADLETIASIAAENNYLVTLLNMVELPLQAGGVEMNKYLIYEFR
jgi:release factor glutamine methyltransferase